MTSELARAAPASLSEGTRTNERKPCREESLGVIGTSGGFLLPRPAAPRSLAREQQRRTPRSVGFGKRHTLACSLRCAPREGTRERKPNQGNTSIERWLVQDAREIEWPCIPRVARGVSLSVPRQRVVGGRAATEAKRLSFPEARQQHTS